MKHTEVDMLSGSIFKGLLSLTIPIMIMNVMQTLFNAIDMAFLGKFADDGAVGAVGVCGTLIVLCTSLFIGISAGANVIIARHLGAKEMKSVEEAVSTAVLFSFTGGIVLMILGISGAEMFLKWINCPEELLEQATLYFRLYFVGAPLILLYNFCASILRAAGDTKRPMYYLLFGGVSKTVLSFCCVALLDMTVVGVAVATIVSNAISGGLAFRAVLGMKDKLHFSLNKLKCYPAELKLILYMGIPIGLQSALYCFANTVIATAVNSFGPDATTGVSIANQFDGILYQVALAPSYATIPYIAQNIGAKNIKRAKQTVGRAVLITVAFGVTLGSLSAVFSGQLSSLMSSTPAVIQFSQQKMIVVSSTYFICGINEVMSGTMRGMGKPMLPTVATLVFMCALRFVWVYLIFPLYPNLSFLYSVWPIGWTLSIIMLVIAYVPAMAKLQRKQAKAA